MSDQSKYNPLNIPKRDRKKGEYIFCSKCNTNVITKCSLSGKALYTCKFPEFQRFQSKATVGKRTKPIKTYSKDLRDYKEFTRLHVQEMARFEKAGFVSKTIKPIRPARLQEALRMYDDWFADVGVPSHQKKSHSQKVIDNEHNDILIFKQALIEAGYSFENLLVRDITDEHIGAYHDYLSKYANRTYNNKMDVLKRFFDYLIKKGYGIISPVREVRNKPTASKKTYIHPEDFIKFQEAITVENGIKFEKDKGQVKRKSLYRPWLKFYYQLSLVTGGRPEGVRELKVDDIFEHFGKIFDFKVSRKKRVDQIRMFIRTKEFNELYQELIDFYDLKPGMYLIEPEETNRKKLSNHASKAFTHYWDQCGFDYQARMYKGLRGTYTTEMIKRFGHIFEGEFGTHDNQRTTREFYAKEEIIIKGGFDKPMFG